MRRSRLLLSLLIVLTVTGACGEGRNGLVATPPASSPDGLPASGSPGTFTLLSAAVSDGRLLPGYRCQPKVNGVEASIPLSWSGVPEGTGSLAIVMYHYPFAGDLSRVSSYLVLWAIDPAVSGIAQGEATGGGWFMGSNKDGTAISYTSPCSSGPGTREYTITLYALSETPPSLPARSSLEVDYEVLTAAIATVRVLGTATITFTDTTAAEGVEPTILPVASDLAFGAGRCAARRRVLLRTVA